MYHFAGFVEAKTYLESLGFSLSYPFTCTLPNAKSACQRASLYKAGEYIGYIESPTDILPDEDWIVNISFADRRKLDEGLLLEIYGDTNPELGWSERYYYLERDALYRIKYGPTFQYEIAANGPTSTVNIKIDETAGLLATPLNTNTMFLTLNHSILAQELRYAFADIMDDVALRRINPNDISADGITPGYVITVDNNYHAIWQDPTTILGGNANHATYADNLGAYSAVDYILKSELGEVLADAVMNNAEYGISVTSLNNKLNFNVNDFTITLTGDVTGSAVVHDLQNVSINTRVVDITHDHDDRYVKLAGDNYFTGFVSADTFISAFGSDKGIEFRTQDHDPDSRVAKIETFWDDPNNCNWLKIYTTDSVGTMDSIWIKSGRSIFLDSPIINIKGNMFFNDSTVNLTGENIVITGTNSITLNSPDITLNGERLTINMSEFVDINSPTQTFDGVDITFRPTNSFNVITKLLNLTSQQSSESATVSKTLTTPQFTDNATIKIDNHNSLVSTISSSTYHGTTLLSDITTQTYSGTNISLSASNTLTLTGTTATNINSSTNTTITSPTTSIIGNLQLTGTNLQESYTNSISVLSPIIEFGSSASPSTIRLFGNTTIDSVLIVTDEIRCDKFTTQSDDNIDFYVGGTNSLSINNGYIETNQVRLNQLYNTTDLDITINASTVLTATASGITIPNLIVTDIANASRINFKINTITEAYIDSTGLYVTNRLTADDIVTDLINSGTSTDMYLRINGITKIRVNETFVQIADELLSPVIITDSIENDGTIYFKINDVEIANLTSAQGLSAINKLNTPILNHTTTYPIGAPTSYLSFQINSIETAQLTEYGIVGSVFNADFAESLITSESKIPEHSTCMVIDNDGKISISNEIGSTKIVGLISLKPGMVLGSHTDWNRLFDEEHRVPICIDGTLSNVKIISKHDYDAGEFLISGYDGSLVPYKDYESYFPMTGRVLAKTLEPLHNGINYAKIIIWKL